MNLKTATGVQGLQARSLLGDDFGSVGAPERPCAGNGESHAPEIRVGVDKFNSDVGFAIALAADGYHAALDRMVAVFIDELEHLAGHDHVIEEQQRAMTVDGLRGGLGGELFATIGLAVNGERHSEGDPPCAAAFFAAKVENGHGTTYLSLNSKDSGRGSFEKAATAAVYVLASGRAPSAHEREKTHQTRITLLI